MSAIENFTEMQLDERLLRALAKMNILKPSLIQQHSIPIALSGKDVVVRGKTGSGKTFIYTLSILNSLIKKQTIGILGVILVPTKELVSQVCSVLQSLLIYAPKSAFILNLIEFDIKTVFNTLNHNQILVSTPGKLIQFLEAKSFTIKETLEHLVLDEADLMLSFGYESDILKIQTHLPRIYQSYLMSATLTPDVEKIKKTLVRNPAIIKLEEGDQEDFLTQYAIRCTQNDRFIILLFMLKLRVNPIGDKKTIIFVNSIEQCYRVKLFLEQFGIRSCVLNAELPLVSRLHIVQEFNMGVYDYIIATDQGNETSNEQDSEDEDEMNLEIKKDRNKKSKKSQLDYGVSRGIDFKNVQAVVNFDLPTSSKSYTHRVGRTARGVGNLGYSLSFVCTDSPTKINSNPSSNETISHDEYIFNRIEKKQKAYSKEIQDFKFDMNAVEGFRYRTEDAFRAVTKVSIKEARKIEIKSEVLNSEKLKSHFEDHPKDLEALKHDKVLHPSRIQNHLRHIPSYLLPKKMSNGDAFGVVTNGMSVQKKKGYSFKKNKNEKGKHADPLKSFKS